MSLADKLFESMPKRPRFEVIQGGKRKKDTRNGAAVVEAAKNALELTDIHVQSISKVVVVDVLKQVDPDVFAREFIKAKLVVGAKGIDGDFLEAVSDVHDSIDERTAEYFPDTPDISWWKRLEGWREKSSSDPTQWTEMLRVTAVMLEPDRPEFHLD